MKEIFMNQVVRWHRFADVAALVAAAVDYVARAAAQAIHERGVFHIVLAGGNTPRAVYRKLVQLDTNWARWQVWFGDERCLPAGNAKRNDSMACTEWLDHVPLSPANIHPIAAEPGGAAAAQAYMRELEQVGEFDLVLLGLGEDGHTASLFPGDAASVQSDSSDVVAVTNAPKPPPQRVSLGAGRLGRSREVLFLVAGAGKRDAVRRWRAGEDLPAAHVMPSEGVDVYLDAAADGDA
jgi:6-phosphogluconolactonase